MAKKQFFAVINTVATEDGQIADFSLIISDLDGRIFNQCSVLVKGVCERLGLIDFDFDDGKINLNPIYRKMLATCARSLVSVEAINFWIRQAVAKYQPDLTGCNLSLHLHRCKKTGIDISDFVSCFDLCGLVEEVIRKGRGYERFLNEKSALAISKKPLGHAGGSDENLLFEFVSGRQVNLPYTALEKSRDMHLPLLRAAVSKRGWRKNIKESCQYSSVALTPK